MREMRRGRQSSEVKRKKLLAQLDAIRTEAESIGVEGKFLEDLDIVKQEIHSARVNIKAYKYFLKTENNKVTEIKNTFHTITESRRKVTINQKKAIIILLWIMILPSICGGKLYYLAIVPESIPVSSALLYTIVGDILFWGWISISIIYAFACFSVYEKYIRLFVEAKLSSLHILMRFACYSVYICIYGQFTFYSASTVPKLISPTWGPSVANVLNVLISCLTSSPFNALIALITIWPVIGMILKKYKKSGRFHFRKISEGYLEEALEDQIKKQS